MQNEIKPVYSLILSGVFIAASLVIEGLIGAAFGTAGLIIFFIGLVGLITKSTKDKQKNDTEQTKTSNKKGSGKALYWILGIAIVLFAIFMYGLFSANKELDSFNSDSTKSAPVQSAGWSSQDKLTLTNNCIDAVTAEKLGYSQSQITNYCNCNTDKVVPLYKNGDEFIADPNYKAVYDNVSLVCADINLQ